MNSKVLVFYGVKHQRKNADSCDKGVQTGSKYQLRCFVKTCALFDVNNMSLKLI